MNSSTDKKKLPIILLGIWIVLGISLFVCWASTQPQALEEVKEITIVVNHSEDYLAELASMSEDEDPESTLEFTFETTRKTLGEAVDGMEILKFANGSEQIIVAAADGEYADFDRGEYWLCYYDNEAMEKPLDTYPIEDGDAFRFYLMTEY